ncbi:HD domain-containing protein [Burkholderiaceae bacterium DAT-1]|nr:HD domain-containing protein [Burkholderiaceae bacterium DAT-1]
MNHIRVRHSDIDIGKPLPWDVYDEKGTLLLSKGYVVATENQVDRLISVGVFADANALKASRLAQYEAEQAEVFAAPVSTPWLDLRKRMELLYEDLDRVMASGQFVWQIQEIARQIDKLCTEKPELAQAIISLNQDGHYAIRHMLDTAVIVRLVARTLKFQPHYEMSAVCAALTMNLGTTMFQQQLKSQLEKPSEEQLEALHQHPVVAHKRLFDVGLRDDIWLTAVLQHHEVLDGSGYPGHLNGNAISMEAQLIRLADIYTARLIFREYRSAVPPTVALRDILNERGKKFDGTLAPKFIHAVGIFPPGLQIRLANGERGVVVRNGTSPNHPVVMALIDPQGNPIPGGVLRDTQLAEFGAKETIDPVTFKAYVDVDAIWG